MSLLFTLSSQEFLKLSFQRNECEPTTDTEEIWIEFSHLIPGSNLENSFSPCPLMFTWGNRIPWNCLHWDTQMRVTGVLFCSTTWKKWEHSGSILPEHSYFPQVTFNCKRLSSFLHFYTVAFPSGSVVKNLRAMQETLGLIPGLGRFPWRREWQYTPILSLGEFHGQRTLVDYSPWGPKELDTIKWLTFFTTL